MSRNDGRRNDQNNRGNDPNLAVANHGAQILHQNLDRLNINDGQADRPENFNWQISKRTLKDRFEYLFNNEALADVHFIVGADQLRVPAHKLGFLKSFKKIQGDVIYVTIPSRFVKKINKKKSSDIVRVRPLRISIIHKHRVLGFCNKKSIKNLTSFQKIRSKLTLFVPSPHYYKDNTDLSIRLKSHQKPT